LGIEQNKWGNVDVRTPKNKKRNRLCGGKPKRVARHQRNELNNRARLFLRACDRIIKEKRRNISFSKEELQRIPWFGALSNYGLRQQVDMANSYLD